MTKFINILKSKTIQNRDLLYGIEPFFRKQATNYSYINPFVYLELRKTPKLLKNIDLIFLDGILLVKLFKIIGVSSRRLSPDMVGYFKDLFQFAQDNKKKIFFIGTEQHILERTISILKENYHELIVAGARNGFFYSEEEKQKVCADIIMNNTDIVILGMGTPYQEKFLKYIRNSGYQGLTFTCGGFLHQTESNINYYPKYINRFNLRWLYRMIDERRVFVRTIKYYPLFLFYFFYDAFKYKFIETNK